MGFLFSSQFKSQLNQRENLAIPNRRIEEITGLLKDSDKKKQELEKTLVDLQKQIIQIKKSESSHNMNIPKLKNEFIITDFTPIKGQGIIITLDDNVSSKSFEKNQVKTVIQNEDLLKLTNELSVAGAEAISINENRLLSNSEISAAGPAIIINKTRLIPPFRIKAIGNSKALYDSVKRRGGVIEYLEFFGIKIKIERKNELFIQAYNKDIEFKYSIPDLDESE